MQINVTKQLRDGVEKARTKNGRSRTIAIEPNLVPLLAQLMDGHEKTDRLLAVGARNRCSTQLREDLIAAGCDREALHVPENDPLRSHLTFHNLKDTCGTHMAVRRDPPQDIQWRLAHSDAKTTEIYIANAKNEAGTSFGTPLGPLPSEVLKAASVGHLAGPLERKSMKLQWRRRESNPGPKISRLPASTCVSGHLSRPRLRGPARSLWDYPPV